MNTDEIYQRIGEFVVCYQWLENKFREIGWLILDPMKTEWPPMSLRDEGSKELMDRVENLYVNLVGHLDVEDREERIRDFKSIVADCHEMRQYRNNLLHSAFIELKAGGDVIGILRSNPKVKVDPSTGDVDGLFSATSTVASTPVQASEFSGDSEDDCRPTGNPETPARKNHEQV